MLFSSLTPAFPELFLALVIMALLMFGVFQKTHGLTENIKLSKTTS